MQNSFGAGAGLPHGELLTETSMTSLDDAVRNAHVAFEAWQDCDGEVRAGLLDDLAAAIESDRKRLVETADSETALGNARLNGELDRTAFQLRRFGRLARDGVPYAFLDDPAAAGPPPAGHPAMRRVRVPLGPVAVFAASNFPFAFSVLGGDTVSALAAGCSVVVKAHPGHPRTSMRTFAAAREVIGARGLPGGLLQLVHRVGNAVGVALLKHPLIAAGAFTGSTHGGAALSEIARTRAYPIPFYGELGSVNPVVATPSSLEQGGDALAQMLADSITLGCGQFCTKPGVLIFERGSRSRAFVAKLVQALSESRLHRMLTVGMRHALDQGTAAQIAAGAQPLLYQPVDDPCPHPYLAEVDARVFIERPELREEIFGPASLIVWTDSAEETLAVMRSVGGALTVTLWGADDESPTVRRLVRGATAIAGRVVFGGVPTGVAVTSAQQHGGPWPSSTEPMTTSVGDAALDRFLRPVALQDVPRWIVERGGRPC